MFDGAKVVTYTWAVSSWWDLRPMYNIRNTIDSYNIIYVASKDNIGMWHSVTAKLHGLHVVYNLTTKDESEFVKRKDESISTMIYFVNNYTWRKYCYFENYFPILFFLVDGWSQQPHLAQVRLIRLWGRVRLHTCGALANQLTQVKQAHAYAVHTRISLTW